MKTATFDDLTSAPARSIRAGNLPAVRLVGEDGNAFAIMGRCHSALRKWGLLGGFPSDDIEEVWEVVWADMTSGDYNHLLRTADEYFEDVGEDPEDY